MPVPETFLLTITRAGRGGLGLLHLMVEARDAAKHPAMHGMVPTVRIIWPKMSVMPGLRNAGCYVVLTSAGSRWPKTGTAYLVLRLTGQNLYHPYLESKLMELPLWNIAHSLLAT